MFSRRAPACGTGRGPVARAAPRRPSARPFPARSGCRGCCSRRRRPSATAPHRRQVRAADTARDTAARDARRSRPVCRRRSRGRRWRRPSDRRDARPRRAERRAPEATARTRHDEHALETAERRLHLPVRRVAHRRAVDHQRVRVDVGRHRIAGDAPDALFVLLHRQPLSANRDSDFLRVGRAKTERHALVAANFRRLDRRRAAAARCAPSGRRGGSGGAGAGGCAGSDWRALTNDERSGAVASVRHDKRIRCIKPCSLDAGGTQPPRRTACRPANQLRAAPRRLPATPTAAPPPRTAARLCPWRIEHVELAVVRSHVDATLMPALAKSRSGRRWETTRLPFRLPRRAHAAACPGRQRRRVLSVTAAEE